MFKILALTAVMVGFGIFFMIALTKEPKNKK
jgi:hypothetical protein